MSTRGPAFLKAQWEGPYFVVAKLGPSLVQLEGPQKWSWWAHWSQIKKYNYSSNQLKESDNYVLQGPKEQFQDAALQGDGVPQPLVDHQLEQTTSG